MIDFGLLLSVLLALGIPTLLSIFWPLGSFDPPVSFVDAILGAAGAGIVLGRLTTLVLDERSSLGRIAEMLIIRSGVDFWPGALAAVAVLIWGAKRDQVDSWVRLADLAPLGMVGYGVYEASCVFRSGCAGPVSPIGLQPAGISSRVLPIGIIVAVAVVASAVFLHRMSRRRAPRSSTAKVIVVGSVLAVSVIRSIASFWLPKLGGGLTRPHVLSLIVAGLAGATLGWLRFGSGSIQVSDNPVS